MHTRQLHDRFLRAFIRSRPRSCGRRAFDWAAFSRRLLLSAALNEALIERRPFSFL